MSRRWLSIWLPDWPLERARLAAKRRGQPFPPEAQPTALMIEQAGVPRLHAVNRAAHGLGLVPGMVLADARTIHPALTILRAEPESDARGLEALALWCDRWSPWPAPDGADGIALDITGCAHLFGGEQGLMADMEVSLDPFGFTHRLAIADRLAAAWAWVRFGHGGVLSSVAAPDRLAELPVRALRIEEALACSLERLGLRVVGDVARLPRASLLTRFGGAVVARLEALFDDGAEPFVPFREPQSFMARLGWPDPIGRTEDLAAAAGHLLVELCRELERAQRGARRFRLTLGRVDGEAIRLEVRTGRPVRNPAHVHSLFGLRWDGLEIGFGIELMRLDALDTALLPAAQSGLAADEDEAALDLLLDQLSQRLGPGRVLRPEPVASHIPERAQRLVPVSKGIGKGEWLACQPRPLRLFEAAEPVQATALMPDSPPVRLDWRRGIHRVVAAAGPERILPEWWRPEVDGQRTRDFYRVTTETGSRFWVARDGLWGDSPPPVWLMKGVFQ
jgi:protein ImuB